MTLGFNLEQMLAHHPETRGNTSEQDTFDIFEFAATTRGDGPILLFDPFLLPFFFDSFYVLVVGLERILSFDNWLVVYYD